MYRRRAYPAWSNVEAWITIFLLILLPALAGFLSRLLGNLVFPSLQQGEACTIRPGDFAWFWPGMFIGMGIVPSAINPIYRIFLLRKYTPYPFASGAFRQRNIKGYSIARPFFFTTVVLAIAASFFLADHYLSFNRNQLVINELTGIGEKTFSVADISNISFVKVRDQQSGTISDSYYVIRLKDHYLFNTRDNVLLPECCMGTLAAIQQIAVDTSIMVRE